MERSIYDVRMSVRNFDPVYAVAESFEEAAELVRKKYSTNRIESVARLGDAIEAEAADEADS